MTRDRTSAPRRSLGALADPALIGWPLFWTSFAIFTLDRLPMFGGSLEGVNLGQVPAIAWSSTVTQIAMFAVLLGARFTFLSSRAARRHPSWTVVTFFIAAFTGDVIGSTAARWAAPVLGSALSPNALGSAWVMAIALCVIASAVSALHRHRAEVTMLLEAQRRLQATRRDVQGALADESRAALEDLREFVNSTLQELSATEPAACVTRLRSAAEDVVRPMSHELASHHPEFTPPPSQVGRPASWRTVLAQVPATPLIRPLITATVMTLLASRLTVKTEVRNPAPSAVATTIGPLTLSVDLQPLLEALLVLATIFLATWVTASLVRHLNQPMTARGSISRRWAFSLIGIVLIGLGSQLLVGLAFALPGFPPRPEIPITVNLLLLMPVLLIAVIDGVVRAVSLRQSSLRAELAQANDELAWEIARANLALWQRRRQIARVIHGPLQASLNAGAISIDAACRNGTVTQAVVEGVGREIRSALGQLSEVTDSVARLPEAIDRVQQLWSEVCHIESSIPDGVVEALARDPTASQTFVEVVSEACANAVIHGQATRILISASLGGRALRISVDDNGSSPAGAEIREGGLGTKFLDDVALAWSRDRETEGTRLAVSLPISQTPAW